MLSCRSIIDYTYQCSYWREPKIIKAAFKLISKKLKTTIKAFNDLDWLLHDRIKSQLKISWLKLKIKKQSNSSIHNIDRINIIYKRPWLAKQSLHGQVVNDTVIA